MLVQLREKVTVHKKKTNVVLQGKGYQKTIIEWNDTALSSGGTFYSFSFAVYADNFVAHNVSFVVRTLLQNHFSSQFRFSVLFLTF